MEARLIALKLFVDELGLDHDISTVQTRKRFQKAVFLGQVAGADLGYRYGWYLMGPYSPTLTRDYYELSEAISMESEEINSYQLNPSIKETLDRIKPLFSVPGDVALPQEDWLELLGSIFYLKNISKLEDASMREKIREEKPQLQAYIDKGIEKIREHDLLEA